MRDAAHVAKWREYNRQEGAIDSQQALRGTAYTLEGRIKWSRKRIVIYKYNFNSYF